MKRALISDVHGNFEALQAVLQDIESFGITEIYCLGDIVGYGPNPCECLDATRSLCKVTILGDFEQAMLMDRDHCPPILADIHRTRDQLRNGPESSAIKQDRWDFLETLPYTHTDGDFFFSHGSAREPTHEYVFPEDIYNTGKIDAIFRLIPKYCFQGHTHFAGIFTTDYRFITPEECQYEYQLPDEKVMVNVGSVGQPRDGDNRACYVILDGSHVTYRRVDYDFQKVKHMLHPSTR